MKRIRTTFFILLCSKMYFGQVLQWAVGMGGLSSEIALSITTDASANVYTTGFFQNTVDFDPSVGTFTLSEAGSADIFISKLDPSGNFVWAKRIGGTNLDKGTSIKIDGLGNVYTTGQFNGTVDFDPGASTFTLASIGSDDIFILKLDASGNFVWAKNMGGTGNDDGREIEIDATGNIYTTGRFELTADFDPGATTFNLTSIGNWDIFVSKLDASGNFVWAKSMGGTSGDGGTSLKLDGAGNVYSAGSFKGTVDFDPGAGVSNLTTAGTSAVFISKLDPTGNFIWAKNIGGNFSTYALSIAVDSPGNVFTTGFFQGTTDFDPGVGTHTIATNGYNDVFISKLDASGNFSWAKNFGGSMSNAYGNSLALDGIGNVYTFGYFDGTIDFDPGATTFTLSSPLDDQIFISKLDTNGNFVWAKGMGGSQNDYGQAITIDASNTIYTTGEFGGTADLDPDAGTYNLTAVGVGDIFINKIGVPVGIEENFQTFFTNIYPNPNNGSFTYVNVCEGEPTSVLIISDLSGKTVYMGTIFNNSPLDLNLSELSNGLYLVKVINKNSADNFKLTINK